MKIMQQCSLSLKNQKKQLLKMLYCLIQFRYGTYIKMESQKIVNLLNDADNESSKFATKNSMPLMITIQKMIKALNLRENLLNQVFVIIQMHIFL